MTIIFSHTSTLASGSDGKVKLTLNDWLKYPIGQDRLGWKFGNSELEIEGKVDFDSLANGERHKIVVKTTGVLTLRCT